MTEEREIFLEILKDSLAGSEFYGKLPLETWNRIFKSAEIQSLLPNVFESVYKCRDSQNSELFSSVKARVITKVSGQLTRNIEFSKLYGVLLSNGLHPIIVKGQLCAGLYPMPDHRISSDFDLLLNTDEFDKCKCILRDNGFSADSEEDESYEVGYDNKRIRLELHRTLFDESEKYSNEMNRFFSDVHKKREFNGEFYTMPPHENMLYLILHSFKHFLFSGVGIRQTCDVGLWAMENTSKIDFELLYAQLMSVNAEIFGAAQFKIARERLGLTFELPNMWKKIISEVDTEKMLDDIFDGGVYGKSTLDRIHSSTAVLSAVKASHGGFNSSKSNIFHSLFPKYSYIAGRYDYVKKYPFLLPVGYTARIVGYIREMKNKKTSVSGSLKTAKERVELLKYYGIIK